MKVVINTNYGGFDLSPTALNRYNELSGLEVECPYNISRDDVYLIQVVEEMGYQSSYGVKLKIVEIPDDVDWTIQEYDGNEWVAEVHRTWS